MRNEDFTSTIGAIYQAALLPERWPDALEKMRTLFDAAAATLFVQDSQTGNVPVWIALGTEAGEREYVEYVKDHNPRARHALDNRPGTVLWDYRVLTEALMNKDVFYDWLGRVHGYRYFVGSRIFATGARSAFTSLDWPASAGHVQLETIAKYSELLSHIEQAFRLTLEHQRSKATAAAFDAVVDRFECGLVILDANANVLDSNARAEAIFSRSDGLDYSQAGLRTMNAADTRKLYHVMNEVRLAYERAVPPSVNSVVVPRRGGRLPYLVTVVPLPIDPILGLSDSPAMALIIREPPSGNRLLEDHLKQLYGLTAREAQLAAELNRGHDLQSAARVLAISANTARVHLRKIFVKTGVHNQRDLVRLMIQAAPL